MASGGPELEAFEADFAGVTGGRHSVALASMHRQPVFAGARAVLDRTSDRLYATGPCLPSGGTMTVEEQDRVIGVVREVWDT